VSSYTTNITQQGDRSLTVQFSDKLKNERGSWAKNISESEKKQDEEDASFWVWNVQG
jgi:hypothetical protein